MSQLHLYRGRLYREAADPARDQQYRQQAVAVYERLLARLKAGDVEIIEAINDEDIPDGTVVGWVVRDLGGLNVALRPSKNDGTNGKYIRGIPLIVLYNGDWGGSFWDAPPEHQRKLLPYAFPRRTFIHEYIHHLDWQRAPTLDYGEHKPYDEMTEQEYIAYLSEPAEFNAWYQSYADDIEKETQFWVKNAPSDKWPDMMNEANAFVRWFMGHFQSDGWRIDILPRRLVRKIQKRLAMTFQHLWADPEKERVDVDASIEMIRDFAWNTMEQTVEGWDYMDDPDGVEERFSRYIGDDLTTFQQRVLETMRIRGYDDDLTPGQQLKFNHAMRELYRELVSERDTVTQTARR